jgi:uncharacterized protein
VLVVIEGKTLLARESIEMLRDLVTDLQLIDGTRGIISIFSARQPPEDGGIPAPLFPDQMPDGAECDAMINRSDSCHGGRRSLGRWACLRVP